MASPRTLIPSERAIKQRQRAEREEARRSEEYLRQEKSKRSRGVSHTRSFHHGG